MPGEPNSDTPSPAAFLDRDGVINREVGYVGTIERFELLPGVGSACRTLGDLGYKVVIVTNQGGIGLGKYTSAQYDNLTQHMLSELAKDGAQITAIYHSPYHPDGDERYAQWRTWRKPEPGMILQAVRDHHLDLSASFLVGDHARDIEAARSAGIERNFFIGSSAQAPDGVQCCESLLEVASILAT